MNHPLGENEGRKIESEAARIHALGLRRRRGARHPTRGVDSSSISNFSYKCPETWKAAARPFRA
jgi:hypothetical protein